jgi:hypothetical protein
LTPFPFRGGLKKRLANLWSRKKITKKAHASRGLETKWEIPIKMTQACRRLNWPPVILIAALVTLISGCASAPEASPEMKQQALSFTPPPGMAGLYVIRKYHIAGAAVSWTVHLDYQEFGSLRTSSYLYSAILPKKHSLRMGKDQYGLATFIAKAGENYYFSMSPPGFGMHPFAQIPEADGQACVRKFKMHVFESLR